MANWNVCVRICGISADSKEAKNQVLDFLREGIIGLTPDDVQLLGVISLDSLDVTDIVDKLTGCDLVNFSEDGPEFKDYCKKEVEL